MDLNKGLLVFLVLLIIWTSADARTVPTDMSIKRPMIQGDAGGKEQLCIACDILAAVATDFLKQNKTESEILAVLHFACSQLHSVELQCILLVDYYSAIFFASYGKIPPEEFCETFGLCETSSVSPAKRRETCTLCRRVVVEVLTKLKDPDGQLKLIYMLFNDCDKLENYAQECKRLVMHYIPYILINGEKYLETNDVCASIHACSSNQVEAIGVIALSSSSVNDS